MWTPIYRVNYLTMCLVIKIKRDACDNNVMIIIEEIKYTKGDFEYFAEDSMYDVIVLVCILQVEVFAIDIVGTC